MDNHLIITLVILAVAIILFVSNKLAADLVALLVVVALTLTGVLTPQEAFAGFSRTAVITIIAIFVLTEALERTGVADQVGNLLQRFGGTSETRLVIVVMVAGAFLSLFMNNIAAAAVLLPAASGAAKRSGVNTSRLLMPLAFSTILGGMATLFTTTNIMLNSLLRDNELPAFSITDFLPLGIPLVVFGIAYIALIGRRLLPGDSPLERTSAPDASGHADLVKAYGLGSKLFRARVPENSSLHDKALADCHLRDGFGVSVVGIIRNDRRLFEITPSTKLRKGDTLILEGSEEDFKKRDVEPYMEYDPTPEWREEDLESRAVEVVEAMLAPRSRLIGKTLSDSHFREKYGLNVLAIWHGDQEIYTDLAQQVLHFGDALLLQGPRQKIAVLHSDPDLLLLMSEEEKEIKVPGKGRVALLIFFATLLIAAIYPELTGAIMLGGALAVSLTKIITTEEAYQSIGWKSVFLVAGMLPMGVALQKTNAAGLAASEIVGLFGGHGPLILIAGMLLVTIIATQLVNGAVAAAMIGPIAIQIAQQSQIDPRTMMIVVAMATSMAFITPLGHSVNILVMSPGGYGFKDYMRVGLPLTVLLFFVVLAFLPIYWPV